MEGRRAGEEGRRAGEEGRRAGEEGRRAGEEGRPSPLASVGHHCRTYCCKVYSLMMSSERVCLEQHFSNLLFSVLHLIGGK